MFGTKVEITLPKAEPGNWATLDIPKPVAEKTDKKAKPMYYENNWGIDLSDIEQVRGVKITDA